MRFCVYLLRCRNVLEYNCFTKFSAVWRWMQLWHQRSATWPRCSRTATRIPPTNSLSRCRTKRTVSQRFFSSVPFLAPQHLTLFSFSPRLQTRKDVRVTAEADCHRSYWRWIFACLSQKFGPKENGMEQIFFFFFFLSLRHCTERKCPINRLDKGALIYLHTISQSQVFVLEEPFCL